MVFLQSRSLCSIAVAIAFSFVLGGSSDRVSIRNIGHLSGEILVDGSSDVFPISKVMARRFMQNTAVRITIEASGSGEGFKKFCAGETDINNSSRPIRESEIALCKEAGIEFVKVPIAFQGIAVVVNNDNNWANCMTSEELGTMWEPAAERKIDNWNQIRDDFPDETLSLLGSSTNFTIYDYFTYIVHGKKGESRSDYGASEDNNVIIHWVQSERGSLGFFDFAYYERNKDFLNLKAIAIENDEGDCVSPSRESIQNGSYNPLSRPLFIYVKKESLENKPAVKAFVEYQVSDSNAWLIDRAGYISLFPESELISEIESYRNSLRGEIFVNGSSTGVNLANTMSNTFRRKNPRVGVGMFPSGSDAGFRLFCETEEKADITYSTRPIQESEIKLCQERGIEFVEIPIAFEAIIVVVNKENNWASCMTPEELGKMWKPATRTKSEAERYPAPKQKVPPAGNIHNWNQIRDRFPDEPLSLYGISPYIDSYTHYYFIHATQGQEGGSRGDFTASRNPHIIAQGVRSNKGALGFFGFAHDEEHKDFLKAIAIKNHHGECIFPSRASIEDGSYTPLSRILFSYIKKESLENKPEVKAFIEYQIDSANTRFIREKGHIPLSPELLSKIQSRIEQGTIGSVFEGNSSFGVRLADFF